MIDFCVSLTSIPSRINNIHETIESINNQSLKPKKIFLNLPKRYKRFPEYKYSEKQISMLRKYNLEVVRCQDYGPATKLMGSISDIKNNFECVILIDDDHIYHEKTFEIFIDNFKKERINYSFYLNKIFNIRNGQCSDGLLINTRFLDNIELFYEIYVKNNKNMFLDDDLWFAIYLYCEKKTYIRNIIQEFRKRTGENLSYKQSVNKDIDALHQIEHKNKRFINRRKIQKIEYLKYIFKKKFNILFKNNF
tara:strand:+ start:40 stop:789 length:750 start_codon:yes stop_codon:yes gene_type:complete